ncbi:MAG: hypothetical protein IK116_08915 [Firmicutes bacterium]|nr:hypothetical protein [Bacillota bacterium]
MAEFQLVSEGGRFITCWYDPEGGKDHDVITVDLDQAGACSVPDGADSAALSGPSSGPASSSSNQKYAPLPSRLSTPKAAP